MPRPWTIPDVRDVLLAAAIFFAGIFGLGWWAGDKTAVNRMSAALACPASPPLARRTIDYRNGTVECVYYWRKP